MSLLEAIKNKWFCSHKWKTKFSSDIYDSDTIKQDIEYEIPVSHTKILVCKKCGKITKITY